MADMRLAVDVVDRGRDVEPFSHPGRSLGEGWRNGNAQGRSNAKAQRCDGPEKNLS
jgi:hypothetical protein